MMTSLIINSMIAFFIGALCSVVGYRYKTRPIIYKMESDKWISINKKPIPYDYTEILVTDGEKVGHEIGRFVKYNPMGKPVLGYLNSTNITAWMPFPEPPKKG